VPVERREAYLRMMTFYNIRSLRGKINIKKNVDINEMTVQSEHASRIFRGSVRGRHNDQ
jgi:hypothetical protein